MKGYHGPILIKYLYMSQFFISVDLTEQQLLERAAREREEIVRKYDKVNYSFYLYILAQIHGFME